MNYKVYNTDTKNWMTYRKDDNGHFEVVREGLPKIKGLDICGWGTYDVSDYDIFVECEPRYIKRIERLKPIVEVKRICNCRPCTRRCIFRKEPKTTTRYTYISL